MCYFTSVFYYKLRMRMRCVPMEEGELKLVHPGGFVEIHKKPVYAYQVMKKNPRHCVTRPDVFKYPWIVVRPESLLKLGTVYFIVPNHTIYRLLQDYKTRFRRPSPPLPQEHHPRSSPDRPVKPMKEDSVFYEDVDGSETVKPVVQASHELESNCNFDKTTLKSCLRKNKDKNFKPGRVRKVSFRLPDGADDDDGKLKRWSSYYSSFSTI